MLSALFSLVLCVSYALAVPEVHRRGTRSASSSSGGSSSYSSSSSSSSSSGSLGGSGGGYFQFPTPFPYHNPSPTGFPMLDFNNLFRQFLASAQAAQAYAAQNPSYSKIFQQQMAVLASEQQMALARFPFAFPGLDSNFIGPDNLRPTTDYGNYGGSAAGTGGYGGGSTGTGGYGGGITGSGGYGGGSTGTGGFGGGNIGGSKYGGANAGIVGHGVGSGGTGGYGGSHQPGQEGAVFTSGSISLGPSGGYGQASSVPGGPDGLGLRISEEFPAPSSGSYGTFSSSVSGVSSVNGKTTSFKSSTFGVNDNGKITFRTVTE